MTGPASWTPDRPRLPDSGTAEREWTCRCQAAQQSEGQAGRAVKTTKGGTRTRGSSLCGTHSAPQPWTHQNRLPCSMHQLHEVAVACGVQGRHHCLAQGHPRPRGGVAPPRHQLDPGCPAGPRHIIDIVVNGGQATPILKDNVCSSWPRISGGKCNFCYPCRSTLSRVSLWGSGADSNRTLPAYSALNTAHQGRSGLAQVAELGIKACPVGIFEQASKGPCQTEEHDGLQLRRLGGGHCCAAVWGGRGHTVQHPRQQCEQGPHQTAGLHRHDGRARRPAGVRVDETLLGRRAVWTCECRSCSFLTPCRHVLPTALP